MMRRLSKRKKTGMRVDFTVGDSSLSTHGTTSIELVPLLAEQLSWTGIDAEQAFFLILTEALRMVRVYLELILEDEDEKIIASKTRLTAYVHQALGGVCRVLGHLHQYLRARSPATAFHAIDLIRQKVPMLKSEELLELSYFCCIDNGPTHSHSRVPLATPDVAIFLKRLALIVLENDPDINIDVNISVSESSLKRKRDNSVGEGNKQKMSDLEQSLSLEIFVGLSLLFEQEYETVKRRVPALYN